MADSVDDLDLELGRFTPRRGSDAPAGGGAGERAAGGLPPASPAAQIRRALRGKHVCPFCGTTRETDLGPCLQCSLEDTPTTRAATRNKLGPWYVLQSRNPSAPGMNFATLLVLIQKGRVTARSVIRGPTTGQFWRHAAKVKGVSREFGLCWNCGGDLARSARACPGCKRLQEPPIDPDVLLEAGESATEDVAERMWADGGRDAVPRGGGARYEAPRGGAPADGADEIEDVLAPDPAGPRAAGAGEAAPGSPVERLAARGGVRRELPERARERAREAEAPDTGAFSAQVGGRRSARSGTARGVVADGAGELSLPVSPAEMAVFQMPYQAGPGAGPRRRGGFGRRVFKVFFVAVLLAGAGVAAMCYLDPDGVGRKVAAYYHELRVWIYPEAARERPPGAAPDDPRGAERADGAGGAAGDTGTPASPSGARPPATPRAGRSDEAAAAGRGEGRRTEAPPAATDSGRTNVVLGSPAGAAPTPPTPAGGAPATPASATPAPTAAGADPAAAPGEPATLSRLELRLKALERYRLGSDQERRGDLAGAVKTWESIREMGLPREEWPLGLDRRIELAKKRLAER